MTDLPTNSLLCTSITEKFLHHGFGQPPWSALCDLPSLLPTWQQLIEFKPRRSYRILERGVEITVNYDGESFSISPGTHPSITTPITASDPDELLTKYFSASGRKQTASTYTWLFLDFQSLNSVEFDYLLKQVCSQLKKTLNASSIRWCPVRTLTETGTTLRYVKWTAVVADASQCQSSQHPTIDFEIADEAIILQ